MMSTVLSDNFEAELSCTYLSVTESCSAYYQVQLESSALASLFLGIVSTLILPKPSVLVRY